MPVDACCFYLPFRFQACVNYYPTKHNTKVANNIEGKIGIWWYTKSRTEVWSMDSELGIPNHQKYLIIIIITIIIIIIIIIIINNNNNSNNKNKNNNSNNKNKNSNYIYIYLAGFSKRLSTVTSPVSEYPPPLFPNFPVPSSYKNGNCLNIRASLDILDIIHPRK